MIVCRTSFPALAVGFIAVMTLSCGGGGSPSSSTPPTTLAPAPTPAPPASGGGNSFSHSSCPLGKGDPNASCDSKKSSRLLSDLEAAMDLLVQQRPDIFDLGDEYDADTRAYRVKDKEAYLDGIVANLRAAGLCAERDADDALLEAIRIKNASDFSEDFDVLLRSGHMRRGSGMYQRTCSPSSFPLDRAEDAPPIGSGCGRPYPPPVTRFNCKVHLKGDGVYTLDSTPLVGPDANYCTSVGFEDRSICPVRPEGAPDRAACEAWRVGKAQDTGRVGPTWRKADGSLCTGVESGCENHPDNQYQLLTYTSGSYTVSAENGASCTVSY